MQLHYCQIDGGNFGDDLNLELWPALFPGIADAHPDVRFYGIGTILGGEQPPGRKVVLGSGMGYRGDARPDPQRTVYWVRGPHTARALGLAPEMGLGDPALLWAGLQRPPAPVPGRVGLAPHFRSSERFGWAGVARAAGLVPVDARQTPDAVARQLASCERVLCESLHAAIFCDALGVPWRAVVLARRFNDFKWRDWLDAQGLPLAPAELPIELLERLSPWKAAGNVLARLADRGGPSKRHRMRPSRAATPADRARAAERLAALAAERDAFLLSDRARVDAQREAMRTRCARFAADHGLAFAG